jgi:hypothetical protein
MAARETGGKKDKQRLSKCSSFLSRLQLGGWWPGGGRATSTATVNEERRRVKALASGRGERRRSTAAGLTGLAVRAPPHDSDSEPLNNG